VKIRDTSWQKKQWRMSLYHRCPMLEQLPELKDRLTHAIKRIETLKERL
jgi:hypothetical protein